MLYQNLTELKSGEFTLLVSNKCFAAIGISDFVPVMK